MAALGFQANDCPSSVVVVAAASPLVVSYWLLSVPAGVEVGCDDSLADCRDLRCWPSFDGPFDGPPELAAAVVLLGQRKSRPRGFPELEPRRHHKSGHLVVMMVVVHVVVAAEAQPVRQSFVVGASSGP